ncbi:MAG: hypothetical protein WD534_06485 [Phycisphaeraceae bacterium]
MACTASHRSATRRARSRCGMLLTLLLAGLLIGCDRSPAPPTTLEGAWLGEGEFRVSRGSQEVTAQLELLSDGSYRFLVLEPSIMALTGTERGVWSREGQTLTLTPGIPERDPGGSVFQQLRDDSPDADRPPKTLVIAVDLADLQFDDGPMHLTFRPNPEATASLQAAGDVTGE